MPGTGEPPGHGASGIASWTDEYTPPALSRRKHLHKQQVFCRSPSYLYHLQKELNLLQQLLLHHQKTLPLTYYDHKHLKLLHKLC